MTTRQQFWGMLIVFVAFLASSIGPEISAIPDGQPLWTYGFVGTLISHIGTGLTGVMTGRLSVQNRMENE